MNTGSWIEVAIYWDVISRYCPIIGRNTQLTIWHYTSDAIICFSLQWSMFAIPICGAPIPGKVYVIAQNFVSCHVLPYPYLACHVMSCQIIYHTIYWCFSMAIVTQYSNRVHGWKTSTTCHCLTLVQLVRLLSSLSDCGFVLKSRGLSYFVKQSYKKINIHLCRLSSFAWPVIEASLSFMITDMTLVTDILRRGRPGTLYSACHCCWRPVDAGCEDIS